MKTIVFYFDKYQELYNVWLGSRDCRPDPYTCAGVVKNLMVKAPAEPDLANRRATEMMQRMKTVETLGADKEALYKEG